MSLGNLNRLLGLLTRTADRRKPCEPVVQPYGEKPSFRKEIPFTPLLRAKPEERGVSSGQIAAFLRELKKNPATNVESVLIGKEDSILCEAVFHVLREAEDKHLPLPGTGTSRKTFQRRGQSLN